MQVPASRSFNISRCTMRWRRLPTGANAAPYDTSARGDIGRRDPIFQNSRKTDFQWALPDRAH